MDFPSGKGYLAKATKKYCGHCGAAQCECHTDQATGIPTSMLKLINLTCRVGRHSEKARKECIEAVRGLQPSEMPIAAQRMIDTLMPYYERGEWIE